MSNNDVVTYIYDPSTCRKFSTQRTLLSFPVDSGHKYMGSYFHIFCFYFVEKVAYVCTCVCYFSYEKYDYIGMYIIANHIYGFKNTQKVCCDKIAGWIAQY